MSGNTFIRFTALPTVLCALVVVAPATRSQAADQAKGKPVIAKICTNCHQAKPQQLMGHFDNVAVKASSIQLKIDDSTEVVQYDEDTIKITNADGKTAPAEGITAALRAIKKGHEIRVVYTEKDGVKVASQLVVKPPITVKPGQLIKTDEIAKLVALGQEKGNYTLVDSRPAPRFQEGAIPTAINIPYPSFDKMVDRLPADKKRLLIFYCSGPTCSMSPSSALKAEKLGYANIRVYQAGMPDWSKQSFSVLPPQSLKEAWIDKEITHLLLDVRPEGDARNGFIRGAISFPAGDLNKGLAKLPAADKKAPLILYDTNGQDDAIMVAKALIAAGQINVKIVTGGVNAWKAANLPLESGNLNASLAYVPKPRVGEISIEEFKKNLAAPSAATVILDARNPDEGNAGMLPNARLISVEDLPQRLSELPRDKEIIAYCNTGVRAEMAYHLLKEKGYTVRYLNGKVEFAKDGKFTITKD
jgi:rhodanese-related sulfurtransferase